MASDPDTNAFWARLGGRERARRWLRTGGEVLGVAGGALAIVAVGFEHGPATTSLLGGAMSVVAGVLALVWTVWLLAAPERRQAAQAHRGTTVGVPVLVGALAAALLNAEVGYDLLAAALVGALVSVASRQAYRLTQLRIPPEVVVLGLFAALIAVGAGALLLPRATAAPGSLAPLDALFMATSAVSVTGLGVVPTAETFTALGEGVLLVLIQVGALGIVSTVVAGTVFFGGGYGIGTRALLQDIWDTKTVGEVRQLVRQIVLLALAIEAVGAVGIYLTADLTAVAGQADATRLDRAYFAVFHAISAFCNAGFSTLSSSFADPALATDVAFNLVAMALIVLGGLGFIVVRETAMRLRTQKPGVQKYGVQVRLVWAMTGFLVVGGALFFFATLRGSVLADLTTGEAWLAAVFQSMTARTAGFNTIDTGAIGGGALVVLMLLMLVGASPGSTGGGLRTTTVAVLALFTAAMLRGHSRVDLFGRTLTDATVQRALVVVTVGLSTVAVCTVALALAEGVGTEGAPSLLDVAFEAVSAFATVGLSRGITGDLSAVGKGILIVTMFIGRVGLVALVVRLARTARTLPYRYPEDAVMVV